MTGRKSTTPSISLKLGEKVANGPPNIPLKEFLGASIILAARAKIVFSLEATADIGKIDDPFDFA